MMRVIGEAYVQQSTAGRTVAGYMANKADRYPIKCVRGEQIMTLLD